MFGLLIRAARWLLAGLDRSSIPCAYRDRPCAGRAWRAAFPMAAKADIRLFLHCFVRGMWISPTAYLMFRPDDRALEIYTSIYGGGVLCGDALECERFVMFLCEAFDADECSVGAVFNRDAPLGDLFHHVAGQRRR